MSNFWAELMVSERFVLGLSPMDGVTDVVMRYMTGKYSGERLDVMYGEFVSVDALAHVSEKRKVEQVLKAFGKARDIPGYLGQDKRPYEVAQIFGNKPELFYQAAVLVATLGFDGVDINMGCPAGKVEELGSGAGLIRTPKLAQEIVRQTKMGVQDYAAGRVTISDLDYSPEVKQWVSKQCHGATRLRQRLRSGAAVSRGVIPVSVKTRIGVETNQVEEWIPAIMETSPAVLAVHGRTLKQLYQGKADWEAIGRAGEIVHSMGGKILGNGDIANLQDAQAKVLEYQVDGVLVGRSFEGNPAWASDVAEIDKQLRLAWILEHTNLYQKLYVDTSEPDFSLRAFMPVRKHLAWYAAGFPGASELRQQLVKTKNIQEVRRVVEEYW